MDFQIETTRVRFGSAPKAAKVGSPSKETPEISSSQPSPAKAMPVTGLAPVERRTSALSLSGSSTMSTKEDSRVSTPDIATEALEEYNPFASSGSSSPTFGDQGSSPYSNTPLSTAQSSLSPTPLRSNSPQPPNFTLCPDDIAREEWTFGSRPSTEESTTQDASASFSVSSAEVLKMADATRELRNRLIRDEESLRQKYIDMEFFRWRTKFEDTTSALDAERSRTKELDQRLAEVTNAYEKEHRRANDLERRLNATTDALESERARTYELLGELNEMRSRLKCEAVTKWEFLKAIFKDLEWKLGTDLG